MPVKKKPVKKAAPKKGPRMCFCGHQGRPHTAPEKCSTWGGASIKKAEAKPVTVKIGKSTVKLVKEDFKPVESPIRKIRVNTSKADRGCAHGEDGCGPVGQDTGERAGGFRDQNASGLATSGRLCSACEAFVCLNHQGTEGRCRKCVTANNPPKSRK